MNAQELKSILVELFGNQIVFNKDFDFYAEQLKEDMQRDLIDWCKQCKEDLLRGYTPENKKMKHFYVFFKKIGNETRSILIKIKNQDFIEIHLADHTYYDDKRKELGLKKSSYYGS